MTMAASLVLVAGSAYLFLHRSQGLPAERRSGPLQHQRRRAFRASASTRCCGIRWRSPTIVAQDPDIIGFSNNIGGGGGGGGGGAAESGPHGHRPEAASRADALGRSDHRRSAAEARAGARRARVHGQSAADQPRRPAGSAQHLSIHAAGHRHRASSIARRRCSRTRSGRFPGSRTSTAICVSTTRRFRSRWTATASRRSA